METRIVEVEEFTVKGYGLQGPLSEIPGKWDVLNAEIAKKRMWLRKNHSAFVCR